MLESLCNIVVDVSPLFVPFHVILLNQSVLVSMSRKTHLQELDILLDILLDVRRVQHSPCLRRRNHFTDQLGMRNTLSALHDPDNCRLRLEITIRRHTLVGLLIFLFGLLGLDLVDLDTVPWMGEVEVHGKAICLIDIFTSWLFREDAEPGAGKRLQRSFEFGIV